METKLNLKHYLELKGTLVALKKLGRDYAQPYRELMQDMDTATRVLTGTALVYAADELEAYIEKVSSDDSRTDFLILELATGSLLGEVVLMDCDRQNRSGHLRIAIARQEHYGRGYGSEALLLALHYGFGMLQLHRVELEVLAYNTRALHVYENLGFRKEGVRREALYFHHRYHDVLTMSMLSREFRERYLDSSDLPGQLTA